MVPSDWTTPAVILAYETRLNRPALGAAGIRTRTVSPPSSGAEA